MNKTVHIATAKNAFVPLMLLLAIVMVFLAPGAAVNVDEQLHYPHAKKVVNWYFTFGDDESCLNTPKTNLKYYGQSVDNFTALVNRVFKIENEFLTRHFTGAVFFWLLILFSGLLAQKISGSWLVAVFTLMALVFMPRLAGQAFGNLKDIPFATGYMAGLYLIIRFLKELPRPTWKTTVLLGLAIAFTVSVRAGGFILFAYLGLSIIIYFVLKPFYLKQIVSTKPVFVRLLGQGIVILLIGYFAGLLFWPYALQNVLIHPVESLGVMEHYKVSIRQVFEGKLLWSTQLPWYYLPKWILISTPVVILAGFVIFLCFFSRNIFSNREGIQQLLNEGFILFAFVFPFIYVIAIDSNLYSGVRQMLFILPPAAILSVIGIYRLIKLVELKNKIISYAGYAFFFLLLVLPLKHQATTFPVDYVYFNALIGGNKNAWGEYEYDYYFHAIKAPVEDLIELADGKEITVTMNCNLSNYFEVHSNVSYEYTRFLERSSMDWDYGIFGLNYLHPFLLNNKNWVPSGILKTYYHHGNPVAVLIKRTDKTDFRGISEIKNGNLQEGIHLLEIAVEQEPKNVWLFVNLAKAKLATGDFSGFEEYLKRGKEIHPYFEPLFLIEATYLFRNEKYEESLAVLNNLFEINPRYLPADKLHEDLKMKLD
jgi:tetratricopeptide (TPR) repeat protein